MRLHIITEGQSEQGFVNNILCDYLSTFKVYADAQCVLTSKDKRSGKVTRGGLTSYAKAKFDIECRLKDDDNSDARVTTMFDLYGLPTDFPGYEKAHKQSDPYKRVEALEAALEKDIGSRRFIPYIQLHEFEALILADPAKLREVYPDHEQAIGEIVSMVGGKNPETINGSSEGAPSKRIKQKMCGYNKPSARIVLKAIGLDVFKEKCAHFAQWLEQLKNLQHPNT